MAETKTTTNWYVAKVQANHEKTVSQRLKIEADRAKINLNIFVPVSKTTFIKNGKRAYSEKIIYPGYIFIETTSVGEVQNMMKQINGTSGFLKGKNGDITPMKRKEIEKIIGEVAMAEEIENVDFVVGETIKIRGGVFDDFIGIIDEINLQKQKMKVSVAIFGKRTPTEIDSIQAEKVSQN